MKNNIDPTRDDSDPQVGELWWFAACKKHFLIVSKEKPSNAMRSYQWFYKLYCLETAKDDTIYKGNMNAHGKGWFRKVSP
jgi:hypothetical protein